MSDSKKHLFRILIFLMVGGIALAVGVRIIYVNTTATQPIVEYYKQGEWIDLNGSYFRSADELTTGYSLCVTSTSIYSCEEYASLYGLKKEDISEPYVLEVALSIQNTDNTEGCVFIGDWEIFGKNRDYVAYMDQQLFMDVDPRIDDILSSISTAPGKEIKLRIPFPLTQTEVKEAIGQNAPYQLVVTKYPARKYVLLLWAFT